MAKISCIEVISNTLCKLNYDTSRNYHQHHDNQPSPTDLFCSANTPMEVSRQTRQNIQTAQTRDTNCACGVYSNIPIAFSHLLSKEQKRRSDRQLPPFKIMRTAAQKSRCQSLSSAQNFAASDTFNPFPSVECCFT